MGISPLKFSIEEIKKEEEDVSQSFKTSKIFSKWQNVLRVDQFNQKNGIEFE